MSVRSRGRRSRAEPEEMNITAFMNLMVVLVPFLLLTAVFSRLTVLELNLPSGGPPPPEQIKPALELEIIVQKDALVVADRGSGPLSRIALSGASYDYDGLRDKLKTIKAEYPDIISATILLEPDTPYDVVVRVMYTVRTFPAEQNDRLVQAELFPEISIGDAPRS